VKKKVSAKSTAKQPTKTAGQTVGKVRSADSPVPKKKPKFFEGGDDGAAPLKKKQK
jgi:hypothetical protein